MWPVICVLFYYQELSKDIIKLERSESLEKLVDTPADKNTDTSSSPLVRKVEPKEEWAVDIDVKQPVDDFYKRIPDMAYKVLQVGCCVAWKGDIYRDYFCRWWRQPAAASASGFPCPEHNFVTVGPNHSKLGMHISIQCQATHLFQWNKISSLPYWYCVVMMYCKSLNIHVIFISQINSPWCILQVYELAAKGFIYVCMLQMKLFADSNLFMKNSKN